MKSFQLTLSNGHTVTGIYNISPQSPSTPKHRPLVVALHGSTYDCHYFDADSTHTASIASTAFGVPFISIDRPCYGGTTSHLPVPEDSSFPQETGVWLHRYILPALWKEFGALNGCNCVVLLCHSLGAMGGIIVGAMHAQDEMPAYPLGGVIISGLGDKLLPGMKENPVHGNGTSYVSFPLDIKDSLMLPPGTAHPDVLEYTARLDSLTPFAELGSLRSWWLPNWKKDWASRVKAPVMFRISEQDCFFEGTTEHVGECMAAFSKSRAVNGALVRGAPHCLELSYWSHGWYAQCFGFALECSASLAVSA